MRNWRLGKYSSQRHGVDRVLASRGKNLGGFASLLQGTARRLYQTAPLQDARLHMAASSLDVYSQTAHLALDHGKRTLRGLRAAVLHKGQCLSLYQIGMVLAGTNNSTRDPTMSLPLQVNQREKLLATGPFSSSPDDSTSARSWHPDFIPHQPLRDTMSAFNTPDQFGITQHTIWFSDFPTTRCDATLQTSSGVPLTNAGAISHTYGWQFYCSTLASREHIFRRNWSGLVRNPKMPDSRSWFPNAALGNLEAPGRGGLAPFCCLNRQKKPIDPLRHVLVRRVIRQSI
ncbi:uncharacterized protein CLUP02_13675 [Colletotrichum lupini]|uniref:Uncharacterized protein n=1 Tax=Colletotrichum lupini TaxID=145971 RepID=A0A9Q8T2X5_9PEZI|nr:uncharacterized protein CLUP02_13675 [Colletotrichum lupini]UQC88152.1 hypothetical protein CLUP02_13675 [Colletotrichum lupini]